MTANNRISIHQNKNFRKRGVRFKYIKSDWIQKVIFGRALLFSSSQRDEEILFVAMASFENIKNIREGAVKKAKSLSLWSLQQQRKRSLPQLVRNARAHGFVFFTATGRMFFLSFQNVLI